jgi:hypothetical protein
LNNPNNPKVIREWKSYIHGVRIATKLIESGIQCSLTEV